LTESVRTSEEQATLADLSTRLDLLIALTKLANRDQLRKLRDDIEKDSVSAKALELAGTSLTSNDFKSKIMEATGASEATVKRRIADLVDVGVLRARRKGREVLYENSGLLG